MKNPQGHVIALYVLALLAGSTFAAKAQPPAEHPDFLRAQAALFYARAHLQRPDGAEPQEQEAKAVQAIDAAIRDIKSASADDTRNVSNPPPVDPRLDWPSRLRRAVELVNKAHSYVAQEVGTSSPQDLQRRVLEDIDKARRHIEQAIHLVQ